MERLSDRLAPTHLKRMGLVPGHRVVPRWETLLRSHLPLQLMDYRQITHMAVAPLHRPGRVLRHA
jgi:hypothetical protein